MKIVAVLMFGGLSVGCIDDSNDLASLSDLSVVITGIVGDDRPNYLEVGIDYTGVATAADHNCAALDVDATLNGVPFAEQDQGGWHRNTLWFGDDSHCARPWFIARELPVGATTIKIADGSKTITVEIPDLTAARGVALATPTAAFHTNDSVAFAMNLAPGDVATVPYLVATTPGGATLCSRPLFDAHPGRERAFVVPDVNARWEYAGCNKFLSPGTAVRADLDFTLQVAPAITNCGGAALCKVSLTQHAKLQSSYVP